MVLYELVVAGFWTTLIDLGMDEEWQKVGGLCR